MLFNCNDSYIYKLKNHEESVKNSFDWLIKSRETGGDKRIIFYRKNNLENNRITSD